LIKKNQNIISINRTSSKFIENKKEKNYTG
jgi:hypothetical protein